MAISAQQNKFEVLLRKVCQQHGLARDDYIEMQEDFQTGRMLLRFAPAKYAADMIRHANALHDVLNDEFRGAVVRAAVPEMIQHVTAMVDEILNPTHRVVTIDPMAFNYKV